MILENLLERIILERLLGDVCKHCNNEFYDKSSRNRHEKTCKIKKENEKTLLNNKLLQIEKEYNLFKNIIQKNIKTFEL
jgi:hypothetical protein